MPDLWFGTRVVAGLVVALTAALLATAIVAYVRTGDGVGGDFLTDYAGGYLVRTGDGESLYDIAVQQRVQETHSPAGTDDDVNPFVLPPAAAWLFAPLSALPYRPAHILFTLINLVALAGTLLLFRAELQSAPDRLRTTFLVAFALSMPAVTNISWGQIDLLLVLAMLLGWRALRTGHESVAALAFGLALFKPHFLLGVVLLLVLQRRWATLVPLAALAVGILVVPALLIGGDALRDYVSLVVGRTELPAYIDAQPQHMANWRGLVTSLTGRDDVWFWAPGALLLAAAALALCGRVWRDGPTSARSYAVAVVLPLLISPHVHMQSMMLLFVGIAVMIRAGAREVRLPGGRAIDGSSALLLLLVVLFIGWFLTANDLAVMVGISVAVLCWAALTPIGSRFVDDETLPLAA
jgi:alpha-1,2-mannosyltransferase